MSSKLDRLEAWFDYQNARVGARSRQRPSWWHAAKMGFGALCAGESIAIAVKASSFGGHALATLFLVASLGLAIDGTTVLIDQWLGWRR